LKKLRRGIIFHQYAESVEVYINLQAILPGVEIYTNIGLPWEEQWGGL